MPGSTAYEFTPYRLVPAQRQLLRDGMPVKLGGRAFDVLLALVERRERTVSKNELMELVWPTVVVEENNLQVQVVALRKLLGPQAIATIPGRGYRFTLPVDTATQSTAASPQDASPPPAVTYGNLPGCPTLFGRAQELQAIDALLCEQAVVTIVGAGGIGKTCMALAIAGSSRLDFPDGRWWIDLAPVNEGSQIPNSIAAALRMHLPSSRQPREGLATLLAGQKLLMVLDSCEHVASEVALLVDLLRARAPGLRLLVTSQEPLKCRDEQIYRLGPLSVPETTQLEEADQFGAVALFVHRAHSVDPRFRLANDNLAPVIEICRRLDGIPLAIELAAARVPQLGVHGVREKLGERFRLLTGGKRTALRRHQTMRATVDWSYALLSASEQAVLRRLGVFVGGFSLELAQQVATCGDVDAWAVVDALCSLVDRSLVMANGSESVRYRLLETMRGYALEKLADAGETKHWMERHTKAICNLFVQADEARFGENPTLSGEAYHELLAPELNNLRCALEWSMSDAEDWHSAIQLAGAGAEEFRTQGLSREALQRMLAIRSHVSDSAEPLHAARFWQKLALLGSNGRLPISEAIDAAMRAQRIYRDLGSQARLRSSLFMLAWSLNMAGESAAAEALLPQIESLDHLADVGRRRRRRRMWLNLQAAIFDHQSRFQEAAAALAEQETLYLNEPSEEAGLVTCKVNRCLNLVCLGRYEEAIDMANSIIASGRGLHAGNLAFVTSHLMLAQMFVGRLDEAVETMRRFLPNWHRDGVLLYGCSGLATLLAEKGRLADAARLDGAALAFVATTRVLHHPIHERARHRMLQLFDAAKTDPADIARWQREGAALDEPAITAICLIDEAVGSDE